MLLELLLKNKKLKKLPCLMSWRGSDDHIVMNIQQPLVPIAQAKEPSTFSKKGVFIFDHVKFLYYRIDSEQSTSRRLFFQPRIWEVKP